MWQAPEEGWRVKQPKCWDSRHLVLSRIQEFNLFFSNRFLYDDDDGVDD